jgi:hypothetical protein
MSNIAVKTYTDLLMWKIKDQHERMCFAYIFSFIL